MGKQLLPVVALVGRTNVGKSTLFNRLATERKSLTFDTEGVTRDVIVDAVHWRGKSFELVDTGGIGFRKTQDPIIAATRACAQATIDRADLFLFVADGSIGLLPEDREIVRALRKNNKPVVVAINKLDCASTIENMHEFGQLGFKKTVSISAMHGTGIGEVLDAVLEDLPEKSVAECTQAKYHVAILGRPNVGKSSLMNHLLGRDRSIVADMPGTTREAISEQVRFYSEDFELTDTAGVRRKRAVNEPLESLMVKSSMQALKQSDIVLMMVDVTEGKIADQELKLAFYAFQEQYKALILVFNKWDLVEDNSYTKERLEHFLKKYTHILKKVVRVDTSCKTAKNIGRLKPLVQKVWERHSQQFDAAQLTYFFQEALHKKPLYRNGLMLRVVKAKQIKTAPITIALTVNYSQFFEETQLGYLENRLRKEYDLVGVPIRFVVRGKSRQKGLPTPVKKSS